MQRCFLHSYKGDGQRESKYNKLAEAENEIATTLKHLYVNPVGMATTPYSLLMIVEQKATHITVADISVERRTVHKHVLSCH